MAFIDELRKFIHINVPDHLSDSEITIHFMGTMSGLVEVRLEEMNDWLDETDVRLSEYLRDNKSADRLKSFFN